MRERIILIPCDVLSSKYRIDYNTNLFIFNSLNTQSSPLYLNELLSWQNLTRTPRSGPMVVWKEKLTADNILLICVRQNLGMICQKRLDCFRKLLGIITINSSYLNFKISNIYAFLLLTIRRLQNLLLLFYYTSRPSTPEMYTNHNDGKQR